MIRQKQMEQSAGAQLPAPQSKLAASNGLQTSDKKVMDNLKDFYKARDAIYSES